MHPTPAVPHVSTGHNRRTSAYSGATYTLATNIEGAPFTRSDCWRAECRDAYRPYMTVRVFLSLHESEPIYVSAPCHDEFARYPELPAEARSWLEGATAAIEARS